jgi:hypothetical protein
MMDGGTGTWRMDQSMDGEEWRMEDEGERGKRTNLSYVGPTRRMRYFVRACEPGRFPTASGSLGPDFRRYQAVRPLVPIHDGCASIVGETRTAGGRKVHVKVTCK